MNRQLQSELVCDVVKKTIVPKVIVRRVLEAAVAPIATECNRAPVSKSSELAPRGDATTVSAVD